jgi:hypothetical protein
MIFALFCRVVFGTGIRLKASSRVFKSSILMINFKFSENPYLRDHTSYSLPLTPYLLLLTSYSLPLTPSLFSYDYFREPDHFIIHGVPFSHTINNLAL